MKDGLYYKKVDGNKIEIGGEVFVIPRNAKYHALVRKEGDEIYLASANGAKLCRLERAARREG